LYYKKGKARILFTFVSYQSNGMDPLKRILAYSTPYKSRYILNILFNAFYSLLSVVSVVSIVPVLSLLLDIPVERSSNTLSGPFSLARVLINDYILKFSSTYERINALAIFCALTVFLFLLRNIFRYFAEYYMVSIRAFVVGDIRNDFHSKILSLPISFVSNRRKGDLLSRISNDVNELENAIVASLANLISAPIMLLFHLAALLMMSYQLTLFAFIVLPLIGGLISIIGKSLKRDAQNAQSELGKLFSVIEESLNAIKIIKIFNAENQRKRHFMEVAEQQKKWMTRANQKRELASPMSEFLGSVMMIFIVWYGGKLVLEKKGMAPEVFLPFIGLFFQLINPAKDLAGSLSNLQKGRTAAARVMEIIDAIDPIEESSVAQPISAFTKDIIFRNVSFSYDGMHPILKGFNLKILQGQSIALVGSSGSGKSTIANLLGCFYDVQEGEILIDGKDIRKLKIKDYQGLFGMVTQDPILFNDTVFNNIALGIENPSQEHVVQAAKTANAHEFIEGLSDGYETFIGDSGNKLSGGQRQRLSIARAVMKNPPIIILDEATSSLDSVSEKTVQKALERIMKERTSLTIAHRLSTVQNADYIIVLEKGKVVEQGKHEELMEKNGVYNRLVSLQSL